MCEQQDWLCDASKAANFCNFPHQPHSESKREKKWERFRFVHYHLRHHHQHLLSPFSSSFVCFCELKLNARAVCFISLFQNYWFISRFKAHRLSVVVVVIVVDRLDWRQYFCLPMNRNRVETTTTSDSGHAVNCKWQVFFHSFRLHLCLFFHFGAMFHVECCAEIVHTFFSLFFAKLASGVRS